jgi:hypothetical protein
MRKLRWILGHVLSIENFQVNRPGQQYARALLKPSPALLAVLLALWVSPPFEQEQRQLGVRTSFVRGRSTVRRWV